MIMLLAYLKLLNKSWPIISQRKHLLQLFNTIQ